MKCLFEFSQKQCTQMLYKLSKLFHVYILPNVMVKTENSLIVQSLGFSAYMACSKYTNSPTAIQMHTISIITESNVSIEISCNLLRTMNLIDELRHTSNYLPNLLFKDIWDSLTLRVNLPIQILPLILLKPQTFELFFEKIPSRK